MKVVPPAGLQLRFRALDCDGNPVRPLVPSDMTVINDEKGVPFGQGGEGDSVSNVGEDSNIELYSVLVLDLSNSIHAAGAIDSVIDGARAFVEETVTKPQAALKHRVAIIAFGRPDLVTLEQDFTQDDAALNTKLEELRVAPPRGTTDLYNAYMMALAKAGEPTTGGDSVVERFVVLLTDGTHEAGNEEQLRSQALAMKHTSAATVFAIGIEGNYDACRLEELAGRPSNSVPGVCREQDACITGTAKPAACTQFLPGVSQTALSQAFQDVAAHVAGVARSNYVAGICTPVSLGNPTLTLKVDVDGVKDEETVAYDVSSLNGDVNSCIAEDIQQSKLACDVSNVCQIVCHDMQCGTDLGESCGTCGSKQICNAAQQCEDACVGMSCGTDQGIDCGTCASGTYCGANNMCLSPCEGMECGTDQGMSCGTCAIGSGCDPFNHCIACDPGVHFAQPTNLVPASASTGMLTGDHNADGKPDIVVLDFHSDTMSLFLNQGNATYALSDQTGVALDATAMAMGNLTGNSILDLAIVSYPNSMLTVYNNGLSQSLTMSIPTTRDIAMADLNNDNRDDIVISTSPGKIRVLLNSGTGMGFNFADYATGSNPRGIAAKDFNGDGYRDLAVANTGSNAVSVLINNGNGTFAASVDYPVNTYPSLIASNDLNADGKNDLVVRNGSSLNLSVLFNQGNGTFASKVDYATSGGANFLLAEDFNGDNRADPILGSEGNSLLEVFVSQPDGTFVASLFDTGANVKAMAAVDADGDGRSDLVVGSNSWLYLLLNKCQL